MMLSQFWRDQLRLQKVAQYDRQISIQDLEGRWLVGTKACEKRSREEWKPVVWSNQAAG